MARYSAIAMDHFCRPRNAGLLDDYDVEGSATLPGQAPFMRLYLRLQGDTVERATFITFGCAAAIASGSMLTEMIVGRRVAECLQIGAEELDQALDGLPEERRFCVNLAIGALNGALKQT